jgi:hypothetical protein
MAFAVGISGDGAVAATGGYFTPPLQVRIRRRAWLDDLDAANGTVLLTHR